MMLRSRKNSSSIQENIGPVKRHAAALKDDPKRKREGLSDLSNVMSNSLCIDSSKKSLENFASKTGLKCRSTNLTSIKEADLKSQPDVKQNQKERFSPVREAVKKKVEPVKIEQEEPEKEVEAEAQDTEADPYPEYDYDQGNLGDPFLVAEYAFDIFKYYKSREKKFIIGDYSGWQPKFTKEMRAVIVDWTVEMQESFELNHETFYTAVKIMDHFLDKTTLQVQKQDLQLMGSTAIFIASKFEERCPPPVEDFLFVCDEAFSHEDMLKMERTMLRTIGFDLGYPLAYRYLRRLAKVLQLDMATLTLARYYLETIALYYEFIAVSDSMLAAACLLFALRVKNLGDWNPILVKYSGYRLEDVEPLMWTLNHAMIMRPKLYPRLLVSFNKYSSDVFFEVANFEFLDDKYKPYDPVGPPAALSFKTMN